MQSVGGGEFQGAMTRESGGAGAGLGDKSRRSARPSAKAWNSVIAAVEMSSLSVPVLTRR